MVSPAIRTPGPTRRPKLTPDELDAVYNLWSNLPEMNRPIEIINGEIVMSPGTIPHSRSHSKLHVLIANHVDALDLGEVFIPAAIVFISKEFVFEPDIVFVRKDRLHILGEKQMESPPDLVVEVLSRWTGRHDRKAKFIEYAKFGIPEYWIADPKKKTIEIYVNEGNKYQLLGIYSGPQVVESRVLPGLKFAASVVFPG